MCGIVGSIASRDITPILVEGLRRLEYRGYDSCGIAVCSDGKLTRSRSTERVAELANDMARDHIAGFVGIAHTRWATHGAPLICNAHPHFSFLSHEPRIALVHNGIVENHAELRLELQAAGYVFESQTDTEVIVHLTHFFYDGDLLKAVQLAVQQLQGAYSIAVVCRDEPERMVAARHGSPLVIGRGDGENFLASDPLALAGTTDQIMYLEDGDVADIHLNSVFVTDTQGKLVDRPIQTVHVQDAVSHLGAYRHYMHKEIFEQPIAVNRTIQDIHRLDPDLFGAENYTVFKQIDRVLFLACGTSYYAALTAKYWIEAIAKIPVSVEFASEYRYRDSVAHPNTLVVTVSQSGETADTLAALQHSKSLGMEHTLAICNVTTSAMVRECKLVYITHAGIEIGVASTKAFTTQLAALFILTLSLAKARDHITPAQESAHLDSLQALPLAMHVVLSLESQIISWADELALKENALFLGRGVYYPIALEGALKLKEISYIHAEAYPAGELKHGPLALVTNQMPVVTVAPDDALLQKLKSNIEEVRARGGELYIFADASSEIYNQAGVHVIHMPVYKGELAPILYIICLQLLAYHTACKRGTDIDKPRNLAKSVTVE